MIRHNPWGVGFTLEYVPRMTAYDVTQDGLTQPVSASRSTTPILLLAAEQGIWVLVVLPRADRHLLPRRDPPGDGASRDSRAGSGPFAAGMPAVHLRINLEIPHR